MVGRKVARLAWSGRGRRGESTPHLATNIDSELAILRANDNVDSDR